MDTLIYILLGVILLGVMAYFFGNKSENTQGTDLGIRPNAPSLPLRIQAYERLALLLERSKPTSLLLRLTPKAHDAHQLQMLLLNTIIQEFEHNYAQQIYVSEGLWQQISATKEKLFQLIDTVFENKKGQDMQIISEEILAQYTKENNFVEATLQLLRNEARTLQNG